MKKLLAAFGAAFVLLAGILMTPVKVHGTSTYTTLWSVWVQSSQIDSTTIGATTPSSGVFTSLSSASGALNGTVGAGTANSGAFTSLTSNSGAINGSVGASSPSSGAFTTLTASSGLNSTAVGNTTPSTGVFTSIGLSASLASSCASYSSNSSAGCTVLLDGKIMQWQTTASQATNFAGTVSVSWPLTFHNCFAVTNTVNMASTPSGNGAEYTNYLVGSCGTTSATIYMDIAGDSGGSGTRTATIYAIGN